MLCTDDACDWSEWDDWCDRLCARGLDDLGLGARSRPVGVDRERVIVVRRSALPPVVTEETATPGVNFDLVRRGDAWCVFKIENNFSDPGLAPG